MTYGTLRIWQGATRFWSWEILLANSPNGVNHSYICSTNLYKAPTYASRAARRLAKRCNVEIIDTHTISYLKPLLPSTGRDS